MTEKRIATAIDVLIHIDKFEHIQITKYAEQKIEYDNEEDMKAKEDTLTIELLNDIIRTMRRTPGQLGTQKGAEAVAEVEEKIKKTIPRWLQEGDEPNIANNMANLPLKKHQENVANQKEEATEGNDLGLEADQKVSPKPVEKEIDDGDLFGD